VREYVNGVATRQKEVFMPLAHRPGHAQVDFGEADGYIGGKKMRFHYFCLDMPHSDTCFVKAYPTEDTESFLDGHVAAFAFLGGVPQSIFYDYVARHIIVLLFPLSLCVSYAAGACTTKDTRFASAT
jgi:transposase